jgi:hypothetical protein
MLPFIRRPSRAEVRRAIPVKAGLADVRSTAPINEEVDLSTYRPLEEQEDPSSQLCCAKVARRSRNSYRNSTA